MTQCDLVGRTITAVLPMTARELNCEAWDEPLDGPVVVLVLDNGVTLYPSRDAEGNGPGVLLGRTPDGRAIAYRPKPLASPRRRRQRAASGS